MRKFVFGMMIGFMVLNFAALPAGFCEDAASTGGAKEGEQVSVDGNNVAIEQHLSDEAKTAEKKHLKHQHKAGKKISKREAKAAGKIRKHERRKERIAAKHAAKAEHKKTKQS